MSYVGNVLVLLALSYLIIPTFLFVHAMAWDCITGSDGTSTDTGTKVIATAFVLLFWALIIFFVTRSIVKARQKPHQGQTTFTLTYVPEKRGE